MLIKHLLSQPRHAQVRSLQIQDILYNSVPEMHSLAFKSGYNLGAESYRHADGGMLPLEHLLENAGIGKPLYHPFESKTVFTSYATRLGSHNVGVNIHVFEAGIISGYLSAHSGRNVSVRETACAFNGASYCMFVAQEGSYVPAIKYLSLHEAIAAVRHAMLHTERHRGNENYYMLSIRPLFADPIFGETSSFLYLMGKLLAAQNLPTPERALALASSFLRVGHARIAQTKGKGLEITLKYNPTTASGRFVDLTSAFISGMVKGSYGRNVRVTRELGKDGVYSVRMHLAEVLNRG